MDLEQVKERYQKLVDLYGDQLPDPTYEPRRFEYYVKLYTWVEQIKQLTPKT